MRPRRGASEVDCLTAALLLAMQASGRPQPKVTSEAGLLPIVPGAVDVVRQATGGAPSVEYEVRESYPASQTIGHLVDAMARSGWRLVGVCGFNSAWPQPADLPETGWGANQHLPTHVWEGRWQGREGREAVFTLRYTCPMEAAGMHSVWVRVQGSLPSAQPARSRSGPPDNGLGVAWRPARVSCRRGCK
jgi:hypothetical protein